MNFPFRVEYLISFNPEEIPSNPCGSSKVKVPPLSTRKKVSPIPKLYFYFFFQKCAHGKFQWKSIDRSIDPPEGSKDLVLLSRKVFGRQKRGKTRSEGRSARVTVTGFVHDWPGFFGVTQVYIQKAGLCIDARSLVVSR